MYQGVGMWVCMCSNTALRTCMCMDFSENRCENLNMSYIVHAHIMQEKYIPEVYT